MNILFLTSSCNVNPIQTELKSNIAFHSLENQTFHFVLTVCVLSSFSFFPVSSAHCRCLSLAIMNLLPSSAASLWHGTKWSYVVWTVFPIKRTFLYIHTWCISSPRAIIHMTTLGAKGTGWIFITSQRAAALWLLLSSLPSVLVSALPVKEEGILFGSNQMTRIWTRKVNIELN